MKLFRKKYLGFVLLIVSIMSPVIIFLYEAKKMAGIKDIFDIEDEDDL
jgi:hypothetical protein